MQNVNTRMCHCGNSVENFNLCLLNNVVGFTRNVAKEGDLVYITVKTEQGIMCGARGICSKLLNSQKGPWPDKERYIQVFELKNVEYSELFSLGFLKQIAGNSWYLKFFQGSKSINDKFALDELNEIFSDYKITNAKTLDEEYQMVETDEEQTEEFYEERIEIDSTYKSIKFKNETDKNAGIEKLVNENFFDLVEYYKEEDSILIAENRLFKTFPDSSIKGISSYPDGLLINFDAENKKNPFRIELIEYECFGEGKATAHKKSEYINSHIIPQLIKFASGFSIFTEKTLRTETVKRWVEKVLDEIVRDKMLFENKIITWITQLNPEVRITQIEDKFKELLTVAFQENIGVFLIIDELTDERKEILRHMISSFKLENNNNVDFSYLIVKLAQKVTDNKNASGYSLIVES